MDQGSLAPLLHLADEETDSAAVNALLRGMGQVCAGPAWTGQNPSLEDAAATLITSSVRPWTDSQPGDRTPGPDSDSATHRATLDKSCPSLGSSCSSSMMRRLSVSHSVMSDTLRPHGLQPTRLLCPWDFPGKNTGVG